MVQYYVWTKILSLQSKRSPDRGNGENQTSVVLALTQSENLQKKQLFNPGKITSF